MSACGYWPVGWDVMTGYTLNPLYARFIEYLFSGRRNYPLIGWMLSLVSCIGA